MSRRRPPRWVEWAPRARERRTRGRDMDWHADRELANTVVCPPKPKGCNAPIGTTCRNFGTGQELENWPAHEARLKRAEAVFQAAAEAEQAEAPVPSEETA
ncbi:hypothetical protein GCM10023201_41220 [Actinomycetospora corticicola]|uniref:Uncharacterized protein n=1 Tax=Actinomycetospora corticicola TaxID=663602 RepID=A0A7Y9DWM7_9PSEU|nr:hypothetical protein [Actinomycetospora corticicola]NYD36791.1 hypothetical protein [Actinomycetospora corticicola]